MRAVSFTVVLHDISIEQVHDGFVIPEFEIKVGESDVVRSEHGSTAWSKQRVTLGIIEGDGK